MTEDLRAQMTMARDSLRAARLLADEGLDRIAASRAYYAMFYVASALLVAKGMTFTKHSAVIGQFGRHLVKEGEVPIEFHRRLIRAEEMRLLGDYDYAASPTPEEVRALIVDAERFVELGDRMLAAFTGDSSQ